MEQRVFEARQVRSFDQVLSATFTFIRILFKPLFRSLIVIAGPFLLAGGIIYGFVYGDLMDMIATADRTIPPDSAFDSFGVFFIQILLSSILLIAAALLLFTAINSFIILYTESRGVAPTPGETWQRTRRSLGRVVGTGFALLLMGLLVFGSLIAITAVLGLFGTILIVIIMLLLFSFSIYITVSLSPIFFVRMQEPIGLFEAISRCFDLIRGYWWQTFGILLIIYLLTLVISYTFAIPQFLLIGMQAATTAEQPGVLMGILTIALTAITFIISQFASSLLFNIAIALQYYSLVERKEAVGLRHRVQDLEQPAPPEGAV